MSMQKPDFLIIGAPRCGTTYLARNLASHPEVFLTSGDNEDIAGDVHFFDVNTDQGRRNAAKGADWYFALFSGAGSAKAVGEKTADYLVDPDAPSLIANTLDHPRIIVIIRDPVERAWSHFLHSRHRLPSQLNFTDIVTQGADPGGIPILTAGLYARQIQPYVNHFGADNILVLVKEDLDRTPGTELVRACSFLGINAEYNFPHIETYVNAGSASRLATITARVGRVLKNRFPRLYKTLVRGPLYRPMTCIIRPLRGKTDQRHTESSKSAKAPLDTKTRHYLRQYYSSDVHQMSQHMGRNLAHLWWKDDPENV